MGSEVKSTRTVSIELMPLPLKLATRDANKRVSPILVLLSVSYKCEKLEARSIKVLPF